MKREELRTLRILKAIPQGMSMKSRLALRISEEVLANLVVQGYVVMDHVTFGDRDGDAWFINDAGRAVIDQQENDERRRYRLPIGWKVIE